MINRIKQLQDVLGVSENELAQRLGMKQSTLNSYTLGKRKPSFDLAESMLTTFVDISAEWLLRGKEPMYISDIPTGGEAEEVLDLKAALTNARKDLELSEAENDHLRAEILQLREQIVSLQSVTKYQEHIIEKKEQRIESLIASMQHPRISIVAEEPAYTNTNNLK